MFFTISELAEELAVTQRTIRYYEEKGLITPLRHPDVAQRLYGNRERARLKLILRGKRLGFSLAQIKEMIDLYDIDPTEREQLQRTITYGEQRLAEISNTILELEALRDEILEYQVKLKGRLDTIRAQSAQAGLNENKE